MYIIQSIVYSSNFMHVYPCNKPFNVCRIIFFDFKLAWSKPAGQKNGGTNKIEQVWSRKTRAADFARACAVEMHMDISFWIAQNGLWYLLYFSIQFLSWYFIKEIRIHTASLPTWGGRRGAALCSRGCPPGWLKAAQLPWEGSGDPTGPHGSRRLESAKRTLNFYPR
jgi:hypothetical protein